MTDTTRPPRPRRWLQSCLRAVASLLFAMLLGGLIGLVVRDRWPIIAYLVYVPLIPLGVAAIIWELAARGRGLPRLRWTLGATGLVSILCAMVMTGSVGEAPVMHPHAQPGPLVLQWNVRWGGGGSGADGKQERWDSICQDIARHAPDIVLLSESPRRERIEHLEYTLGAEWTSAISQSEERAHYLYRMVVLSRWPVTLEREAAIPTGRVMQALVGAPGGDIRVLVVDGESHPWHDRVARLRAVAQFCRDAERAGQPIDLIAGDFNTVGRSIGFDAITEAGYHSATKNRATWPSIWPVYDIDHVWVGNARGVISVERFTCLASDHLGQVVRIADQRDK